MTCINVVFFSVFLRNKNVLKNVDYFEILRDLKSHDDDLVTYPSFPLERYVNIELCYSPLCTHSFHRKL